MDGDYASPFVALGNRASLLCALIADRIIGIAGRR